MRTTRLPLLLPLLLLTACASRYATLAPSGDSRATRVSASSSGVAVVARPNVWVGNPPRLEAVLPLRVSIDNDSGRELRIRYDAFTLSTDAGKELAALPPFDIEATEVEPIRVSGIRYDRFHIAPHHARYYPLIDPCDRAYRYHPGYWDHYHPRLVRFDLPTEDMVRHALPEGVISQGGKIEGFLYFEPLPRGTQHAVLHVDLVEAESGRPFGDVELPFDVRW